MKKLNDIIEILKKFSLFIGSNIEDIDIEEITYDSRNVKNNTLFFCKGLNFKEEYLLSSKETGAVCYVSEKKYDVDMPYILVNDIRIAMMEISRFFYDYPDRKIKTIGVTGTKGKSTTVMYIKNILDEYLRKNSKKPAGLISSIDVYDGISTIGASLTTPEAIDLYRYIKNAVDSGLEYMIIETSSQALKYYRINNLEFDLSLFLNIGEDHVSPLEHSSFDDYFDSKLKIFNNSKFAIYNKEIDFVDKVKSVIKDKNLNYMTFSNDDSSDISLVEYKFIDDVLDFSVKYEENVEEYKIHQYATYNIENAMAAILTAKYFGIDYESIYKGLINSEVDGRENILITNDEKYVLYVSYAHNELSFQKTYDFIKERFKNYSIISIYGISGNVAENRLNGLVKTSTKVSDYIYIVPEDSGYTSYDDISKKIINKISPITSNYMKMDDREEAIRYAFENSGDKTVIFIAGKGNEDFQKINGKKIKIKSDYQVAKEIIEDYNSRD
ncbi:MULTISPECIES: Mur ligase family protein [Helcococcus]|uniref:UDP-N-acetylmuramyl-tripeptide synthetase n=1 Tax=Helcococcus bovis TaxID=3153252 RepID=A0ABW9F3M8_9FIRM